MGGWMSSLIARYIIDGLKCEFGMGRIVENRSRCKSSVKQSGPSQSFETRGSASKAQLDNECSWSLWNIDRLSLLCVHDTMK